MIWTVSVSFVYPVCTMYIISTIADLILENVNEMIFLIPLSLYGLAFSLLHCKCFVLLIIRLGLVLQSIVIIIISPKTTTTTTTVKSTALKRKIRLNTVNEHLHLKLNIGICLVARFILAWHCLLEAVMPLASVGLVSRPPSVFFSYKLQGRVLEQFFE